MRERGFNFFNKSVEYSILINMGAFVCFSNHILGSSTAIGSFIQDEGFIVENNKNTQMKRLTFYEDRYCQDVYKKLVKIKTYIESKNKNNIAIILRNDCELKDCDN